jgi:predicted alpha/beta superfamily hydrolase
MRITQVAIVWPLALLLLFVNQNSNAQLKDSSAVYAATSFTVHSRILNEDRKISVQTPLSMDKYSAYPVIYLADGESFSTLAGGQVGYLSESYKIIPQLIIVGIYNKDRMRDLTPSLAIHGPDGKIDSSANAPFKNTGGGENYLRFIKEELMPLINARYHTAPFNIFFGHSLGGLIGLYALTAHPVYFNAYISISPSLQWDQNKLLNSFSSSLDRNQLKGRYLFFSDANEDMPFHQNQLVLDSILQLSAINNFKYKRAFYPEESHLSEPVKGLYDGLRFIYPEWHLPYNSSAFRKKMTADIVMEHYKKLSGQYGYKVVPGHDEINQISKFLRNDSLRIDDAIKLLEINAINYPSSAIVPEILGDTWLKKNNNAYALLSYKKALELDPLNKTVSDKIKKLQP